MKPKLRDHKGYEKSKDEKYRSLLIRQKQFFRERLASIEAELRAIDGDMAKDKQEE